MRLKSRFWCVYLIGLFIVGIQMGCSIHTGISNLGLTSESPISPVAPGEPASNEKMECDSGITTSYGGGDGQSATPYAICSLTHWKYFAVDSGNWNQHFKLYSDLDFSGVLAVDFKTIGNVTTPFTGTFDGNNKTIKNIDLTGVSTPTALFLRTNATVEIKNLSINSYRVASSARVGALVLDHGNGGSLTIENIKLDNITFTMTGGKTNIGTLVGSSAAPISISNVVINTIHIPSTGVSGSNWGGLVGSSAEDISVSNVTGNSISLDVSLNVGGVVGVAKAAAFSDINLTGISVRGGGTVAGLVGRTANEATVTRVRLAGQVLGAADGSGIISENWGMGATSITITESSFTGDVSGTYISGGLVGTSFDKDVTITRSFYKGNLDDVYNGVGAGFIANAQGTSSTLTIEDSYVVGDITNSHATNNMISGFVANPQGNVIINRSFYSGALEGSAPRTCVGKTNTAQSFVTNDVYFDSTLCNAGAGSSGGVAGSTGLSTTAFQQLVTPLPNWLSSVWSFNSGQNHPKLKWEEP